SVQDASSTACSQSQSGNATVTVNQTYNVTGTPVTACENYTLPWGTLATTTNDYSHTYASVNGCDSIVTIHVTINHAVTNTLSPVTACESYSLPFGGTATVTNDYSHTYTGGAANGCDSTVTVHVTINHAVTNILTPVTACESYDLPFGGTATVTNDYSHTYTAGAANGCDSTVTVHVTINHSVTNTLTPVTACESYYLPFGGTATVTNDYSHTYTSGAANGCDSTVTVHVTINHAVTNTLTPVTACESYDLPFGGT